MSLIFNAENTTWTCFGCEKEAVESDDLPQFCPKCGGVWVRPLTRQIWWRRVLAAMRERR